MMGQMQAVVRREVGERMARPGYWIIALLGAVVMVAFVVLPSLLLHGDHASITIGTVNVPKSVLMAAKPAGTKLIIRHFASAKQGLAMIRQHNFNGFFRDVSGHLTFYGQMNGGISVLIANLSHKALIGALPSSTLQALVHAQSLLGVKVVPVSEGAALVVRQIAIYALDIIMVVVVAVYGTFIAMSVLEEKESRHAEMLMAWIRPRPLLFGKIISFGIMSFVQVGIWSVAGIVAVAIKSPKAFVVEGFSVSFVLLFLLWAIVGYLQFATAYAALASRAQRMAELNQAVLPMNLLVMVGYAGAILAAGHPDGLVATIIRAAAFLPFLAPMLALATLQLGAMPWWAMGLDAVFQVMIWWVLLRLAARLFQRNLLHYRPVLRSRRHKVAAGG